MFLSTSINFSYFFRMLLMLKVATTLLCTYFHQKLTSASLTFAAQLHTSRSRVNYSQKAANTYYTFQVSFITNSIKRSETPQQFLFRTLIRNCLVNAARPYIREDMHNMSSLACTHKSDKPRETTKPD